MTLPQHDVEVFIEIERLLRSGQELESLHGFYRPVSDQALIERALVLANMKGWGDFGQVWAAFGLRPGTVERSNDGKAIADIGRTFSDEQIGGVWQDLFAEDYAEYQREQKAFLEVLEAIKKNRSAARQKYEPMLAKRLENIMCVGFSTFRGGHLQDKARPYLRGIHQAWGYAAALLLDDDRPASDFKRSFGDRLRICARGIDEGVEHRCGNWFLSYAGDGGGPMKKYCSDECTAKAILAATATRQTKHRRAISARKPK